MFFSECLHWLKTEHPKSDINDLCLCSKCNDNAAQELTLQPVAKLPTINHTNNMSNVPAAVQQLSLQVQPPPQQLIAPICWFPPPMCSIPIFCCEMYKQHCLQSNKRGRPPHDKCCVNRKKTNGLAAA